MRIVVDMQGAQSESRFRGIGRYVISLVTALVENSKGHEIILVVNGAFADSALAIRRKFAGNLHRRQVRVWTPVAPTREGQIENNWRRQASEILFQSFIDSLKPDVFLCCSLFEGYIDDAVTILPPADKPYIRSVIVYDLIPHKFSEQYLDPHPTYKEHYYGKFKQIPCADLIFTISDHSKRDIAECLGVEHSKIINIQAGIQLNFGKSPQSEHIAESLASRWNIDGPFILYVGGNDFRKNLRTLIRAYSKLPRNLIEKYKLVFAGQIHGAGELIEEAENLGLAEKSMAFLSHVRDTDLVLLYDSCELVVCPSLYEGFGLTVLEAMAFGAPVVCSNTSSHPEVLGDESAMFDPMDVDEIAATVERALTDKPWREKHRANNLGRANGFTWQNSVRRFIEAINSFSRDLPVDYDRSREDCISRATLSRLINDIALLVETKDHRGADAKKLAHCIATNHPSRTLQRTLFVDISELSQRDAGTGIQRVTRSILQQLLANPPVGYRVQPVYATTDSAGFLLANGFTRGFLGLQGSAENDEEMQCEEGDIFLGLDLSHHPLRAHEAWLSDLASRGVQVWFVIYDLLPIRFPQFWPPEHKVKAIHEEWLRIVTQFRGVLCISKTVAAELEDWLQHFYPDRLSNLAIESFQLGAEIDISRPRAADDIQVVELIAKSKERPTLLMVGTLEPRKGHAQVLAAAELMWQQGLEINLAIVGHKGWLVDDLLQSLEDHEQRGERLFVMDGISDEQLERVYSKSACLVAASYGEGFGLPLVEAAQRGLSIICRDIPVFREVAGDHAFYFDGHDAESLADALAKWLDLYRANEHPKPTYLPWISWKTSASQICTVLKRHELPRRQLLVDVSGLETHNAGERIQRVVKNILRDLMTMPPGGYAVKPVYATPKQAYRYADSYISVLDAEPLGTPDIRNEIVEPAPDDIFLCLDINPETQISKSDYFDWLRIHGVYTCFLLHELLPNCSPEGASESNQTWLNVVAEADGVVCTSRSDAEKFNGWLRQRNGPAAIGPRVVWINPREDSFRNRFNELIRNIM